MWAPMVRRLAVLHGLPIGTAARRGQWRVQMSTELPPTVQVAETGVDCVLIDALKTQGVGTLA